MYLSEVLSVHKAVEAENSKADILGDAFLTRSNPIYRSIKTQALRLGCTYVEASTQYLLMPFHQLEHIVSSKEIPYVPSARLIQSIEDKRADVLTTEDVRIPESYHMHEAAHVLAEEAFRGVSFASVEEKILKAVVCESFANTVDALVWSEANGEIHHFFLRHNCYMHPEDDDLALISRVIQNFGSRFAFVLTLLSYVHSNFLQDGISQELIEDLVSRYAPEVKVSPFLIKDAHGIGAMAARMDLQFRLQTTKMYLNLEGYDGETSELLDFEFMKTFNENRSFRKVVEKLASVVNF